MMEKQYAYLETLLPQGEEFESLEAYAQEHYVPIMDKVSVHFLSQLAFIQQPESILEIGTAIGYSTIKLASVLPTTCITTLERDEEMVRMANDNITEQGLEAQIDVVPGDAEDSLKQLEASGKMFDFIFIDAAKAQYKRFFKASEPMLNEDGIIICDNVLFRGYVAEPDRASSQRLRKLATKIGDFNHWLFENKAYHTSIVPVGDGITISKKRV